MMSSPRHSPCGTRYIYLSSRAVLLSNTWCCSLVFRERRWFVNWLSPHRLRGAPDWAGNARLMILALFLSCCSTLLTTITKRDIIQQA